ncbi:hypothetical protein DRN86_01760 [Candidatus Geothermarchaeota archaeon]|nr:MAG: hypothetical protein DRN86_01760 [Candidatus Geothermarchaeota archaeon]
MRRVKFSSKKVGEVMTHGVVAVDKTLKVSSACIHMVRRRVRGLLVLSEGKFEGIVTASDILFKIIIKQLPADEISVGEIMSSPLITIDYNASVEDACKLMMKKNFRHLPVVRDGNIVGMITPTDILRGVEFKG